MLTYFLFAAALLSTPQDVKPETQAEISPEPIQVVTLGSFHFDFPNLDVQQIDSGDQIDVHQTSYQQELDRIAKQLAAFAPTHIVVEQRLEKSTALQQQLDDYLQDPNAKAVDLPRGEVYQLGFRLAELRGLGKLYPADAWGKMYESVQTVLDDKQKVADFGAYYKNNPDSNLRYDAGRPVYKEQGIAAELLRLNNPANIQQSLGNYLIGHFKFENETGDYFGADFEAGRWFSRNLRIFRNVQRIPAEPGDRILVIFGAGHMNLLNLFFDASPEYQRQPVQRYLTVSDNH